MTARSLAVRAAQAGSAAAAAAIARRHLGGAHVRDEPELFGRGGVVHGDGAAVVGGHPGAVDEAQLAQQQRIFEFHGRIQDSAFVRQRSR